MQHQTEGNARQQQGRAKMTPRRNRLLASTYWGYESVVRGRFSEAEIPKGSKFERIHHFGGSHKGGFQHGGFGGCSWTPKTGTRAQKPERGYKNKCFWTPKTRTWVQSTERRYKQPKCKKSLKFHRKSDFEKNSDSEFWK